MGVYRSEEISKWFFLFFGEARHIATISLEQRRTANSKRHKTICLPVVSQEICKTKRRRRVKFEPFAKAMQTVTTTPPTTETIVFFSTQKMDESSTVKIECLLLKNKRRGSFHLERQLMSSEHMFWIYLNQGGKSVSVIGSKARKSF